MKTHHVTCRFSISAMNGKNVNFEIPMNDGTVEFGTGILRARPGNEGKIIIHIDSPNPPAVVYSLDQSSADRLEVDSTGETDYLCILPHPTSSVGNEDQWGR